MTRILIADDHPVFRRGLVTVLERYEGFAVVGEADDGEELLALTESSEPDLVILDLTMPRMDGLATAKALNERGAGCKKIFLTLHKNRPVVRLLDELGVSGYVLKDSAISEIVESIETVMGGGKYISPALRELFREGNQDDASRLNSLTTSEIRILRMIGESRSNREIAKSLFVSIRTVETHRYNMRLKLNLKGANTLLEYALLNKSMIDLLAGD